MADKSKPSWMMKGKAAQEALKKEEAKDEQRRAEKGKMFRFWLKPGETCQITFLDGKLDDDGVLDNLTLLEHNLFLNNQWGNHFTCTQLEEPCPVCEGGAEARLVGVFTILDHREYQGKKQTYKHTRKLFVAKQGTLKMLQSKATKYGGLAGRTFDVTRTSDNEASVGNDFDFVEKYDSRQSIADKYGLKLEDVQPADYEEEIPYYTADQLREKGFGGKVVGAEKGAQDQSSGGKKSYSNDL